MRIKRAVMMGVLLAAIAAIALPVIGLRARAASSSAEFRASARAASLAGAPSAQQQQAAADQAEPCQPGRRPGARWATSRAYR